MHDARNCLAMSDGPTVTISGLDDIAVIVHDGAVLVVPRDRSQGVKHVVDALKAQGRKDLL
jgi:mannose-1-phosphate guanylyltransferase/mannose-6-phosphate isomerase